MRYFINLNHRYYSLFAVSVISKMRFSAARQQNKGIILPEGLLVVFFFADVLILSQRDKTKSANACCKKKHVLLNETPALCLLSM